MFGMYLVSYFSYLTLLVNNLSLCIFILICTQRCFLLPFKRPHERVADKDLTDSFEDASGVVCVAFCAVFCQGDFYGNPYLHYFK